MYIQCCAPVVPDAFFMMCDLWSSEILYRIFEYLHRAMSDIDEPEVAVATDDLPEAEAPDSSLAWNVVGAVTTASAPDSGEISSDLRGLPSSEVVASEVEDSTAPNPGETSSDLRGLPSSEAVAIRSLRKQDSHPDAPPKKKIFAEGTGSLEHPSLERDVATGEIRILTQQKSAAVAAEDFSLAAKIQRQISELKSNAFMTGRLSASSAPSSHERKEQLLAQKADAIHSEDFDLAAKIHQQIKDLDKSSDTRQVDSKDSSNSEFTEQVSRLTKKKADAVAKEDFAAAAKLQSEIKSLESLAAQKDALLKQQSEAVALEDYSSAAKIQQEIQALVAPRSGDRLSELSKRKDAAVAAEDYQAAAQLQQEIQDLQNNSNTQGADAVVLQARKDKLSELDQSKKRAVEAQDFDQAARIQRLMLKLQDADVSDLSALLKNMDLSSSASTADAALSVTPRFSGSVHTIASLLQEENKYASGVKLERVVILAVSRRHVTRGGNKGAGKKGKNKQGGDSLQAMYLGQGGHSLCVVADSEQMVKKMPNPSRVGCAINISGLNARPTQNGVVDLTPSSVVELVLGSANLCSLHVEYCSLSSIQDLPVGSNVDMPCKVLMVREKSNNSGEVYVEVHGQDCDGAEIGPVRVWQTPLNQFPCAAGDCVVMRGLRISVKRSWSNEVQSYVESACGGIVLEWQTKSAIQTEQSGARIVELFK